MYSILKFILFCRDVSAAPNDTQRSKGCTHYNQSSLLANWGDWCCTLTSSIQGFIKTKCRNQDNGTEGLNKSGSFKIGADISPSSHLIPKMDNLRWTLFSRLLYVYSFQEFGFISDRELSWLWVEDKDVYATSSPWLSPSFISVSLLTVQIHQARRGTSLIVRSVNRWLF